MLLFPASATMPLRLYLDESGTLGFGDEVFTMAMVLVKDIAKLEGCIARNKVTQSEIKASQMKTAQKLALARTLLEENDLQVFLLTIDPEAAVACERKLDKELLYDSMIAQAMAYYLQRDELPRGQAYRLSLDMRGGIRESFEDMVRESIGNVLMHRDEPLVADLQIRYMDSKYSAGVQVADLFSNIYRTVLSQADSPCNGFLHKCMCDGIVHAGFVFGLPQLADQMSQIAADLRARVELEAGRTVTFRSLPIPGDDQAPVGSGKGGRRGKRSGAGDAAPAAEPVAAAAVAGPADEVAAQAPAAEADPAGEVAAEVPATPAKRRRRRRGRGGVTVESVALTEDVESGLDADTEMAVEGSLVSALEIAALAEGVDAQVDDAEDDEPEVSAETRPRGLSRSARRRRSRAARREAEAAAAAILAAAAGESVQVDLDAEEVAADAPAATEGAQEAADATAATEGAQEAADATVAGATVGAAVDAPAESEGIDTATDALAGSEDAGVAADAPAEGESAEIAADAPAGSAGTKVAGIPAESDEAQDAADVETAAGDSAGAVDSEQPADEPAVDAASVSPEEPGVPPQLQDAPAEETAVSVPAASKPKRSRSRSRRKAEPAPADEQAPEAAASPSVGADAADVTVVNDTASAPAEGGDATEDPAQPAAPVAEPVPSDEPKPKRSRSRSHKKAAPAGAPAKVEPAPESAQTEPAKAEPAPEPAAEQAPELQEEVRDVRPGRASRSRARKAAASAEVKAEVEAPAASAPTPEPAQPEVKKATRRRTRKANPTPQQES